jgi:hypothetical protein
MQIVNGYICMNCCDIDKARMGQDPHQATDQLQKQINKQIDPLAPANFGPAVSFGGSLKASDRANGADATSAIQSALGATPPAVTSGIDVTA